MRVNGLAWRHEANLSTALSTARYSRSVGDFFSSVFDHLWLAYARVFRPLSEFGLGLLLLLFRWRPCVVEKVCSSHVARGSVEMLGG